MDHIPEGVRYFLGKRLAEACGLMLLACAGALALAFLTWSVQDPSFNHATSGPVRNLLGGPGAMVADLTMQMVGIAATAVIVPIGFWGLRLMNHRRLERLGLRMVLWMVGVGFAAAVAGLLPATDRWPLPSGLGGVVGDAILTLPRKLSGGFGPIMVLTGLISAVAALLALSASSGFFIQDEGEATEDGELAARSRANDDDDAAGEPVARAGSEDEDALWRSGDGAFLLNVRDLLADVGGASIRVSCGADEASCFWFDDHWLVECWVIQSVRRYRQ